MKSHDPRAIAADLASLEFHRLADFNRGHVGVFRCGAGTSPWERHPEDEELLHVLEGAVDIIVMGDDGPTTTRVEAGSLFVVPRGLWHGHRVPERLVELYVTPGPTEMSHEEDPR